MLHFTNEQQSHIKNIMFEEAGKFIGVQSVKYFFDLNFIPTKSFLECEILAVLQ